ncbi:nitrogen regulation protein NR(II) [Bowmanella sp. JS7-9]|uniref:Sensory histidine kinase/phosphatase NtrB n=1 Tax=Pseudobowmanella zhangzhouensis TaxID=1537679 RepID=A0ABW1XL83_9ALTE|nr:nitrogen regulation protein NR(II) [Bowmanella sp. JS7-9]TBX20581.1 nitrogen regulation protein NR(II) [Bowmanella sp. JS7-9]
MQNDHIAQHLLQSMTTALVLVDNKLAIQRANAAAEALLRASEQRLLGQRLPDLLLYASLPVIRLYRAARHPRSFSDSEVQVSFHDGRHSLIDFTASPLEIDGAIYLLLEVKVIDQQRRISQENVQWAQQQAAKEMVRGLAHEIKNPLGGLRGAAQLLQRQLDEPELQEFTQIIIEQADRLRNLVDRLLGPNRPAQFTWQNIHAVIEKIRTLIALDDIQDTVIIRDYDPSIPDVFIDAEKMQQALLNIVRNSVQALQGRGQISLITRVQRQQMIHGRRVPLAVEIKIIDNGPGIPEHLRDTLFYPMVTGKQDGTGLGLSIAQNIIDHHKGKIECVSWPGHTEFVIYLPLEHKEHS